MTDDPDDSEDRKPTHDNFFKMIMQLPDNAALFLRERLPRNLVKLLGPGLPEEVPGSFVDAHLQDLHSDLLLRMALKDGTNLLVYFLLEHKSDEPRLTRIQLAQYIFRVLDKCWLQTSPTGPMPVVVPVLVHNGLKPWPHSTQLTELAGKVHVAIRQHMLSLDHLLVDLATMDKALSGDPHLRTVLRALKHGKRKDLHVDLDSLIADVLRIPGIARTATFVYISARVGLQAVRASMQRVAPEQTDEMMNHVMEPYYREGIGRGMGLGAAQALAKAVLEIAEMRFAPVSDDIREGVACASEATLHNWLIQLITAESLDEVFGPQKANGANGTHHGKGGAADPITIAEEARREALARSVLRIAEKRFAPISSDVGKRVARASEATLQNWLERLIDAETLEEALVTEPPQG
jgi:hypothetical protein